MAGYIGVVPTPQATQTRDRFEATAGQTSFPTSGYTPGFLDVYANGLKINSEAYTATNGSDVVFGTAREEGDVIEVVAYSTFEAGKVTPDAVSDKDNESTGYFALPSGTTAQRPVSAAAGYTRYNSDTGSIEFYDGTSWIATNLIPTINSVTGTIYSGASTTLTLDIANPTDTVTVRFSEGGATVADVADVTVTSGSASVSVPAAVYGHSAGDTISVSVLNQDGTPSSNGIIKTVIGLPTGGSISNSGGYRYHTFTSSSSLVVPTGFTVSADYLIVAGGGGGGSTYHGAGGGAGGAIDSTITLSAQAYSVTIGSGGAGGVAGNPGAQGSNGQNSTAFAQTAIGGGGGGSYGQGPGKSGGSGGGGAQQYPSGGSGTPGQGNAGGNTLATSSWLGGGGGGGASEAGGNGSGNGEPTGSVAGAGGDGINWKSLGTYYAGGGSGSYGTGGTSAPGGLGGGGAGSNYIGGHGSSNTGGGGGGSERNYTSSSFVAGGNGGSGIVIVRYQIN